jgi:DNA-directed RNA polymerase specialized sigma24 family protein
MKITYTFADDTTSEVEVSEEVGTLIMDSRREESNGDRKERYHCWSLDAIDYEGTEYSTPDFASSLFDGTDERDARVRKAFSHLTETQQRRMLMLAAGLSEREIARREGVAIRAVTESIDYARKKFLKFF